MTPPSRRIAAQEQWLNFFNNVVYDRLAPLYNAMDWLTFGLWWRLVSRALDYVPPGQRVLEVGFGPGRLHVELARRAALTAGVDLAWGMCRFTRRRLGRAGLTGRVVQGSVHDLPCAAGAFDVVVSTFAFAGFPQGPRAMREMARVTRAGGRVVLIDIGLPSDGNRWGTLLARLWERMGDFLYDQPALMREAGLRVVHYQEFGPGRHIRAIVGQKAGQG